MLYTSGAATGYAALKESGCLSDVCNQKNFVQQKPYKKWVTCGFNLSYVISKMLMLNVFFPLVTIQMRSLCNT